jgi:hypothetical protein
VARRIFDIAADAYKRKGGPAIKDAVLPGVSSLSTRGQLDSEGVAYGGGRADVRLSVDGDGEIYALSKTDGLIRKLTAVVMPPRTSAAGPR